MTSPLSNVYAALKKESKAILLLASTVAVQKVAEDRLASAIAIATPIMVRCPQPETHSLTDS